MKTLIRPLILIVGCAALANPQQAAAQSTAAPSAPSIGQSLATPTCAWPFEWSPYGLGNWLFPDTGNRWWYMPIDAKWESLTIRGVYPGARFFSFATYDNAPIATALADHVYDAEIAPDPESINPFDPAASYTAGSKSYSVTVSRGEVRGDNVLQLHAKTGWLLYRLYLPNAGLGSMGGVPLPSVTITDAAGGVTPLKTCPTVNRQSELTAMQPMIVPAALENPPPIPPVPDHIWFAPLPTPPVRLLPNPDNKYMVSYFMSDFEPDRIMVIRGKMPAFPDTYRGAPVSQPAPGFSGIQIRYWSMCLGALVSPLPITGCAVDAETALDEEKFYTVVISNDVLRPDWLPLESVWLPWGDEQMFPKTIIVRNTLPSPGFGQSVQQAIANGCGVEFNFPTPPSRTSITEAGKCTQTVMGDYYPVAVWCAKGVFIQGGWKACFDEAGIE